MTDHPGQLTLDLDVAPSDPGVWEAMVMNAIIEYACQATEPFSIAQVVAAYRLPPPPGPQQWWGLPTARLAREHLIAHYRFSRSGRPGHGDVVVLWTAGPALHCPEQAA